MKQNSHKVNCTVCIDIIRFNTGTAFKLLHRFKLNHNRSTMYSAHEKHHVKHNKL